jgi:hypothetical protein
MFLFFARSAGEPVICRAVIAIGAGPKLFRSSAEPTGVAQRYPFNIVRGWLASADIDIGCA